jgi:hypothetical protein
MDVKEISELAKKLIAELFASEGAYSIRLEEIRPHVKGSKNWDVTVSFLRSPPEQASGIATFVAASDRAYKIVHIDEDARSIVEIRNKATAA